MADSERSEIDTELQIDNADAQLRRELEKLVAKERARHALLMEDLALLEKERKGGREQEREDAHYRRSTSNDWEGDDRRESNGPIIMYL